MTIEFLEEDNDDIACISCTHMYNKNHSSFCAIDDHYIFYANLWCQTCEQHMLIDTTQFGKGDADNATF